MSGALIYIDRSRVREGKREQLIQAMGTLAEFVEQNEPQLLAYNVYFNQGGSQMNVIHVHRDAASLERHMAVAGPMFPTFAGFVELLAIDVYGDLPDHLLEQLRGKARLLGGGTVVVHALRHGFSRFASR